MPYVGERLKTIGLVLLVVVVLGTGVGWWLTRQVAARGADDLSANATLQVDEIEIGAQRGARLARYRVAEGQSVKAGQVIAELDASELSAQLEQAQGEAGAAEAALRELRRGTRAEELSRAEAEVVQARANVEGAQKILASAQKGYARRTPLRQALDAAVSQRDVARAGVRQAESALAGAERAYRIALQEHQTTVQLRQERDAARQQLQVARANHRLASARLDQLVKGARGERLRAVGAQLRQAAANPAAVRAELDNATEELARARKLHAGNALSDQALEAAQRRADTARARYEQALQGQAEAAERLAELQAGARPEEIEVGRAAVQQAEAAVEGGERALENTQQAYDLRLLAEGQLEEAQTGRAVAQAQLAGARAALAGAERAVHTARTAYSDALQEKQSADSAAQQYQASLAVLEMAEALLEQLRNGATPEQIEQARGQYLQARGALQLARIQREQCVIRAPRDGVIIEHLAQVGETLTPGATVARLTSLDRASLTLYVPHPQIGKIKRGQRVEVTADTYPGNVYSGQVAEISERPEFTPRSVQTRDGRSQQVFRVKVDVDNRKRELKPGMPVHAAVSFK